MEVKFILIIIIKQFKFFSLEKFLKLGVVVSALQIFEELEMWEEIIECYKIMGKDKKVFLL